IDIIVRHAQHLARLVEDISVLSRAESRSLELEKKPIDLLATAKHVIDGLQVSFDKKQISVAVDDAKAQVIGDPISLEHVMINLIDNALKYTPEHGRVQVHALQRNGQSGIAVENTGPGIPPAQINRVFERFYRLDSARATAASGSGLGLS